ncbi:YrzE family protein [Actinocatenispora sera]|uniref:Uncharacterized protein n=1 Tax=Actinocatenispora sera TaxID=390989 RepID=A0A810L8F6_9ACTN|nr:YrzE family protein [Actinocatenispora sera]BCJ31830.1 hypothetical protein Asera_59380 [Actinocatenispora sera]
MAPYATPVREAFVRLVGRYPRVQLQHVRGARLQITGRLEFFSLTRIRVPRADRHTVTATMRCETCGDEVELRIFGLRGARRARLAWLSGALAAVLVTLVLFFTVLTWTGSQDGAPFALALFGGCLAAGCVIGGFVGFHNEDGVRLVRHRTRFSRSHSLTR